MTVSPASFSIAAAVDRACARIAPTWPLDRFIAVNPFWGRIGLPIGAVADELAALSGARLLMPRAWYRDAWTAGRLRLEHLQAVVAEDPAAPSAHALMQLIHAPDPVTTPRERVMDVVDRLRDLTHAMSWRDFVVHSTSQACAAFFDEWQAELQPDRAGGLYACWRRAALQDRAPVLAMGLTDWRAQVARLPASAEETVAEAVTALGIPEAEREAWLTSLLLDVGGWAAWCAYRRWIARQRGAEDAAIVALLGVRAAWELVLFRSGGAAVADAWAEAKAAWAQISRMGAGRTDDWYLQRAMERAYADPLQKALILGLRTQRPTPERTPVQAVFCIDVRSEPYRRALEAEAPVQTLGFAGFFGLPVEHLGPHAEEAVPQLPGLLAPSLRITDIGASRASTVPRDAAWRAFQGGALSAFSFVESLGLPYAAALVRETFGAPRSPSRGEDGRRYRITSRADGAPLLLEDKVRLAAGILRSMSLTRGFSRLVVLIGHGSTVRNNPHRAGLDCGACCGSTGEVNARAAAALFNEPEVRAGLAGAGIVVPETTRFVAGLHNTTTDEVALLETDTLPDSHYADLMLLRGWLRSATLRAQAVRAPRLGLGADVSVRNDVLRRADDWAEVRPEWGLADNAAFIVAPREHVRHLDLAGRSFLHEYRHTEDEGYAVLEGIMTAPMVVTHWINLQYYASTVDNQRYGSGNKLLHNVVGGHLGVFEGNGGDLRIGLPMQCLHDGTDWVHTPLRLQVFIEAPRHAIEGVLARHEMLRQLVRNGWLFLHQIDAEAGRVSPVRVT